MKRSFDDNNEDNFDRNCEYIINSFIDLFRRFNSHILENILDKKNNLIQLFKEPSTRMQNDIYMVVIKVDKSMMYLLLWLSINL